MRNKDQILLESLYENILLSEDRIQHPPLERFDRQRYPNTELVPVSYLNQIKEYNREDMFSSWEFKNFDEMEKDGKPANIGEALSRFMSGNNPSKLMGLVGKFGSKLQDEVKKGNINPAELLSQTMSAAGGGGQNLQDMMNNPRAQAQMKEMQKNNSSRDRMRAKLAAKKNAEKEGKQD